jgi:hypothetical protein
MQTRASMRRDAAESLAVQALTFLAGDPERLARFLALSGIGPDRIRSAAASPGFLAGVLDHVASEEALLMAFAEQSGIDPADVARARQALAGGQWERGQGGG